MTNETRNIVLEDLAVRNFGSQWSWREFDILSIGIISVLPGMTHNAGLSVVLRFKRGGYLIGKMEVNLSQSFEFPGDVPYCTWISVTIETGYIFVSPGIPTGYWLLDFMAGRTKIRLGCKMHGEKH